MTEALRPRRRTRRRPAEESMAELLEALGAMVSAHREVGYGELRGNPEFWKLVAKLRQARRHDVARRMREVRTEAQDPGLSEEEAPEPEPEPEAMAEPPPAAPVERRRVRKPRAAPVAEDIGADQPAAEAEPAPAQEPEE